MFSHFKLDRKSFFVGFTVAIVAAAMTIVTAVIWQDLTTPPEVESVAFSGESFSPEGERTEIGFWGDTSGVCGFRLIGDSIPEDVSTTAIGTLVVTYTNGGMVTLTDFETEIYIGRNFMFLVYSPSLKLASTPAGCTLPVFSPPN